MIPCCQDVNDNIENVDSYREQKATGQIQNNNIKMWCDIFTPICDVPQNIWDKPANSRTIENCEYDFQIVKLRCIIFVIIDQHICTS